MHAALLKPLQWACQELSGGWILLLLIDKSLLNVGVSIDMVQMALGG